MATQWMLYMKFTTGEPLIKHYYSRANAIKDAEATLMTRATTKELATYYSTRFRLLTSNPDESTDIVTAPGFPLEIIINITAYRCEDA